MEEFNILLPETPFHEAGKVVDRLLWNYAAAEVATDDGGFVKFTVSIGIASMSADNQDLDATIQSADKALYKAKTTGRNRWCDEPPGNLEAKSGSVELSLV
ncbi:MAG: GGDEF domain-containing protein [Gammaproteobacteria bacterium]|nr:GGDEF domain-containing protein [Gammaproteobacteria bacterium]